MFQILKPAQKLDEPNPINHFLLTQCKDETH